MLRRLLILLGLILLFSIFGMYQAQETPLISPSIFLRGLELANGVRYTASFVKSTDDAVLRNLSVEITLPADAQFLEMLVSRQVQFDVIRRNRQGQLTLIWQISRVDAETALDTFSFTLAEPLSAEIEFYMVWQDEQGQGFLENFFELPTTIRANETTATISLINSEFAFVGNTGIQVSSTSQNTLNFQILANDFNPPAEYGDIWWCSLVELSSLESGDSAVVIVPLRRPVAPFTELFLFQQQADGSWLALDERGIVSADGQFVMYRHLGGLIATGGDEKIQQEVIPVEQVVIEEAPPPQENPAPQNNEVPPPAPIENIVVVEVQPVAPPEQNLVDNNNQQNNPPPTAVPASPIPATIAPAPTQNNTIQDGSSNTILLGEASPTPLPTTNSDGSSNTILLGEATSTATSKASNVTIVTSGNTGTPATQSFIVVGGKTTVLPTILPTIGNSLSNPNILPTLGDGSVRFINTPTPFGTVSDGTSNTIIISEATATNTSIQDGTSNTIIVGDGSVTPSLLPTLGDGSVRLINTPTATPFGTVSDGTSNTIIISEATPTNTSIQDGTSNTIIVGDGSVTPSLLPTLGDGSVRLINTPTATPFGTVSDGTSNTIIIIERTLTPSPAPDSVAPTSTQSPATATVGIRPSQVPSRTPPVVIVPTQITIIIPPPFGSGGARIVIVQGNSNGLVQCQIGGLLCAPLNRRVGNGLR